MKRRFNQIPKSMNPTPISLTKASLTSFTISATIRTKVRHNARMLTYDTKQARRATKRCLEAYATTQRVSTKATRKATGTSIQNPKSIN